MADASLPEIRALSRLGTAIAAMMPMIATTISSSTSVNPAWLRHRSAMAVAKGEVSWLYRPM